MLKPVIKYKTLSCRDCTYMVATAVSLKNFSPDHFLTCGSHDIHEEEMWVYYAAMFNCL